MPENFATMCLQVNKESSAPEYTEVDEEGIEAVLELLRGRLAIQTMFQSLPTEDLWSDLQHLVMIQRAIVHVLQLVEGTASDVMNIFVARH